MGVDDWERTVPWVRQAIQLTADRSHEAVLDALVASLRAELLSLHRATAFSVYRRMDAIFVEWSGNPEPSRLADEINVDPTYAHESGVEVGTLWGEDLPESLATVSVLLKHSP